MSSKSSPKKKEAPIPDEGYAGKKFTFKKRSAPKKAPPAEKTTFAAFEKVAMESIPSETDLDSLIEEILQCNTNQWIPLLMVNRDSALNELYMNDKYSNDFVEAMKKRYNPCEYHADFDGVSIKQLSKAMGQIASNIVYTNDGGDAYFANDGLGYLEMKGQYGDWKVDVMPKNRNVVAVNSTQCVDLQLFCSAIDVQQKATVVDHGGIPQTVYTPAFIKKNVPQGERIPYEIKELFTAILCDLPDEPTDKEIKTAAWVWDGVAHHVLKERIPIMGCPIELAYFMFVKKTFGYEPSPLALQDVYYKSFPFINKDIIARLSKYSFIVGGIKVSPYHYMNVGLCMAKTRLIGGQVPKKLCRYNTAKGITWEALDCYIESNFLGTSVNAVRPMQEFDGLWYDIIASDVNKLRKAKGVIVPYDKKCNNLAKAEEWVYLPDHADCLFTISATFGPQPLLWIEIDEAGYPYSTTVAKALWKTMPVMPLYNFLASLNRNVALAACSGDKTEWANTLLAWKAEDVPVEPVAAARYTGVDFEYADPFTDRKKTVPQFNSITFSTSFLPGRHLKKTTTVETPSEAAKADYDRYKGFADEMIKADPSAFNAFKRFKRDSAKPADHDGMKE